MLSTRNTMLTLAICTMAVMGLAGTVEALSVEVTPGTPDETTPVSIWAYEMINRGGSTIHDETVSVTGFQIDLSFISEMPAPLPPGRVGIAVMAHEGPTFDLGTLAPGTYTINATSYQISHDEQPADATLWNTTSATFDVEPLNQPEGAQAVPGPIAGLAGLMLVGLAHIKRRLR